MAQAISIPTASTHSSNPLLHSAHQNTIDIFDNDQSIQDQPQLQEFKRNVELSKQRLVQLIENDQYATEAKDLNRKAVELINEGYISQACILLAQAERLLQYAANRGKEINRNLIVAVLHNEAFCHQQSWSLDRCANYVEALIYNLNCQVRQSDNESESGLILTQSIQNRNNLAKYYLLFCAINSQLKRNDAALIAAKKANALLKNNSNLLFKVAVKSRVHLDQTTINLLQELSKLQSSAQNLTVSNLMSATKYFYGIWKNKCSFPNLQLRHLMGKLKDFSIGNIMQMEVVQYKGQSNDSVLNLSLQEMLERVVTISISYFTMATELRLLAIRFAGSKEEAKELSQFRESQCYHLIAIILILYHLPFDILYLKHILTSFQTHYQLDIEQLSPYNGPQISPQEMFQILLTQPDKEQEYKGSTAGNSEKGYSSRNSYEGKNMQHSKLQSCVRASLKGHQPHGNHRELAKLNNYYYIQGQLGSSKQKAFKQQTSNRSTHKDIKSARKRAFFTSKNSTQKTPIAHTPGQLSPKRSKCSSKSSRGASKKASIDHTKIHEAKKISVMEEYFDYELPQDKPRGNKLRSKSKKKTQGSKQNKEYLSFVKLKKGHSPSIHTWRGTNTTNHMFRDKSNEQTQFKSIKSTSKIKGKLFEAKSKKKTHLNR